MKTNKLDYIDFEEVNSLLEGFNKTTGFVTAILDLEGNVLSKSGWRQMCVEFHRVNPETARNCSISDTVLSKIFGKGEKYHFYECLNGLVDVAVPIIINGEHVANLFSGQFFFEDPDREFFKRQARNYGFNEEEYLKALYKVPVVSEEKVKVAMDFLLNMTQLISEITFQRLEQVELNEALVKSEEALRELNETLEVRVAERTFQLTEANKELDAFSYSVSHDLRSPLRHINGYADILSKQYSELFNGEALKYLGTITDSAKKMGSLIDDLLSFSRTGRSELNKSVLNMNRVIDEALVQIKPNLADRNIDWEISQLPAVRGDYNLMLMVWINLLDNAVKYTRAREKALIQIGFKEESNDTIFFIKDNGAGFDMKYAQKLFGVFQRMHSSSEFEGTGIGLANVRRIILRHGGRTWAEAEEDKGATFYFSIPK
jgi:signal transduction histidine kinase